MTKTLHISGMTCGSCVRHVKEALLSVSGVSEATVNLENESATVVSERDVPLASLSEAVKLAGYEVR